MYIYIYIYICRGGRLGAEAHADEAAGAHLRRRTTVKDNDGFGNLLEAFVRKTGTHFWRVFLERNRLHEGIPGIQEELPGECSWKVTS